MTYTAINVQSLAKRYSVAKQQAHCKTLGEKIAETFSRSFFKDLGRRKKTDAFWALRDVSFSVEQGEVVGVVGRNGAGKSTLLKILSRITEPSRGAIDIYGRVGSLLEVGTGFHYELTGKENIYLSGAIMGMKRAEIARQFDEIVAFAEIEKFLETPVKHYSSGMLMRLAFAVSAHLQPEILLIDEVLAVGDAAFQRKCLGKMGDVARQGRTVLFVSHNMSAILELCSRALLIEKGNLVYDGHAAQCVKAYYEHNVEDAAQTDREMRRAPLRIDSVALGDGNGTAVKAGSEFSVAVRLSGRKVSNPAIYFIVENVAGQTVVHKQIKSRELGLETIDGHYRLKITLPALWLSPGVYSAYFKFIAPSTDWAGTLRSDRLMIEMRGELEGTGKSVLNPQVKWQIDSPPQTSASTNGKHAASAIS